MLHIQQEQFRLFELAQRERFLDECARVLLVDCPNPAKTGPDLREWLRLVIRQLSSIGFTHDGDYMHALRMLFRYQQEAWRGPMPEVIIDKLRSAHLTTEKKIEALEQLFIFGDNPNEIEYLGPRER